MRKHTQIYLQGMGYKTTDFVPCEVCEAQAVDVHHIEARGMGGNKKADVIENLMGLCRECHIKYGDKKQYKDFLKEIHLKNIPNGKR
jgi:5-methylcytosine-specific restriction endonuclease McrA